MRHRCTHHKFGVDNTSPTCLICGEVNEVVYKQLKASAAPAPPNRHWFIPANKHPLWCGICDGLEGNLENHFEVKAVPTYRLPTTQFTAQDELFLRGIELMPFELTHGIGDDPDPGDTR